jgi:hypothetical protein
MPNTIRNTADLLTILPDNSTAEISPQDIRDCVVSGYNRLDNPGLTGDTTNASLLTSGTVADARLSANVALKNVNNAFSTAQTVTGTVTATTFSGSGASLTALNASNLASGTVPNARTTATANNTANTIVARDASNNFAAGTITATAITSISGNTLLIGDTGGAGSGPGKSVLIQAQGVDSGAAGSVTIVAGYALSGTNGSITLGADGPINLSSATAIYAEAPITQHYNSASDVSILGAGCDSIGTPGNVIIGGGVTANPYSVGGNVTITGGNNNSGTDGSGGSVSIVAGSGPTSPGEVVASNGLARFTANRSSASIESIYNGTAFVAELDYAQIIGSIKLNSLSGSMSIDKEAPVNTFAIYDYTGTLVGYVPIYLPS